MSTKRFNTRCAAVAATVAVTGLLGAGTASAHVSANVYGEQPAKGGYGTIALRVPNEETMASTTKVRLSIPAEYEISSARTKPVPGWTAKVSESDDVVDAITFTAGEGHEIPAGTTSYQEFHVSLGPLPENVDRLVLPAAQTYSDGTVVRWDQKPTGKGEPEHPAPVVALAEASGHGHGTAQASGKSATHAEGAAPGTSNSSDTTARWLGGAGLALGALGFGLGTGAALRLRKVTK